MKLKFNGKVNEFGRTIIYDKNKFEYEMLMFKGKEIIVTVEARKKKRSDSQNKYYWAVVVNMVREGMIEMGHKVSMADVHEFLKHNFASVDLINEQTGEIMEDINGNPLKVPLSTAGMSTTTFMVFLADVQQWASEFLNIYIPDPNEQTTIDL